MRWIFAWFEKGNNPGFPPDLWDVFCQHALIHQLKDPFPHQRSKMLDLFIENVIQSDGFTGFKGVDADIELFRGERLSQSHGLGVFYSIYLWSWLFSGGFPIEQQLVRNLVGSGRILLLIWG